MYFLITQYELPVLAVNGTRKLITIANKDSFTDMYDYHPLDIKNKTHIISEKTLKDFMKNGFASESEAENAFEVKNAIIQFIGLFFNSTIEVISGDELLQKYKTLK